MGVTVSLIGVSGTSTLGSGAAFGRAGALGLLTCLVVCGAGFGACGSSTGFSTGGNGVRVAMTMGSGRCTGAGTPNWRLPQTSSSICSNSVSNSTHSQRLRLAKGLLGMVGDAEEDDIRIV